MAAGPDGLPVYLRFARDDRAGGRDRKRVNPGEAASDVKAQ